MILLLAALLQAKAPALERAAGSIDFQGPLRGTVDALTREWLLKMPDANPALLGMFADRDKKPYRSLLPWSGEFAGKYLTGAVQVLRLTGDPALRARLERFVGDFLKLQDVDGYLGPFPKEARLTGKAPNLQEGTWDAWGHYHAMLGLLLWHEASGDKKALEGARKIGDLLCRKFLSGKKLVETGSAEMNHAPVHGLGLLYRKSNASKHLDLAKSIVKEFEAKGGGDYVRVALAGKEFFEGPKPRWESLHPIQGLAELHWLTGQDDLRTAFENIWWSITKLDRHDTGGFSSGEQAKGNPYDRGAIETCCTVAWAALGVDMLRLTGNPVVADELELSTFNAILGYQSRDGRWCTYNTPMDGPRVKSTDDIAFQIRPGSEEVNCCSANAPRGFGLVSEWALMTDGAGLALHWYGAGSFTTSVAGTKVVLRQDTAYPRDGRIALTVDPEKPLKFALRLRIPHWSWKTEVKLNGEAVETKSGTYLVLDREWKAGDKVDLDLDFRPHFWAGEKECGGKAAVYRGPVLLAWSRRTGKSIVFSKHWKKTETLWVSKDEGATLTFEFEGNGVRWVGRRYDDAGIARVFIDGRELGEVDQYGPRRDEPFEWAAGGLAEGRHVMKVAVTDLKNRASKGRFINVARFEAPGLGGDPPVLDLKTPDWKLVESTGLVELETPAGRLRDFASAGEGGAEAVSWLFVEGVKAAPFSKENPLRSWRP